MVADMLNLIKGGCNLSSDELSSLLRLPVHYLCGHGVPITQEGFWRNLEKWASTKGRLALELSKHPKWDDEKWAIVTEMEISEAQNIDKARDNIKEIILRQSSMNYVAVHCLMRISSVMTSSTISQDLADIINEYGVTNDKGGVLRTKEGARIGRVIRQVMEFGGAAIQKEDEINISNVASAIRVVKQTVPLHISIHPIDFMLMSRGTSWSTCQTLNSNLSEGMSRGEWRRGVFSYMNDGVTVVAFIPSEDRDNDYPKKRCRNLFHISLDNKAILQGRLYPYGVDNPIHKAMRMAVVKEISSVQGWDLRKAVNFPGYAGFFQKDFAHYPDYTYEVTGKGQPIGANVTSFIGSDFSSKTPIGNSTYCTKCGTGMGDLKSGMILCRSCQEIEYGCHDDDDDDDDFTDEHDDDNNYGHVDVFFGNEDEDDNGENNVADIPYRNHLGYRHDIIATLDGFRSRYQTVGVEQAPAFTPARTLYSLSSVVGERINTLQPELDILDVTDRIEAIAIPDTDVRVIDAEISSIEAVPRTFSF